MGKGHFYKMTVMVGVLAFATSFLSSRAYSEVANLGDQQVGTLSEGACWYEFKDSLKVASFNDKTVYNANKDAIEANLNALLINQLNLDKDFKITGMNLSLHCGGYGASLVARITSEVGNFCLWAQFSNGKLSLRSIGPDGLSKNPNELCDGHKWGELIVGVQSSEAIVELQSQKWSNMIQSVTMVTSSVYKIVLTDGFKLKENEVAANLQESFAGKNLIRYIEFNDYRHPVGEYVHFQ